MGDPVASAEGFMQGKAVRLFSAIAVLLAAMSWMIACSNQEAPPPPSGGGGGLPELDGGGCASPHPGCSCDTNGQSLACGEVISTNGSYTTCSQGTMTCVGSTWSACKGQTVVQKSREAYTLGANGHYGYVPMYTPTPCGDAAIADICDPNPGCTVYSGSSSDVDAAGVYPTSGGGVSLNPDAGAGSTPACIDGGLQCNIAYCGSGADAGTTISGTVTDPAGINPLYGIYVYIPEFATQALPAFTSGVSCQNAGSCTNGIHAVSATTTAADGTFKLSNVPTGVNVPVVMQSGKWRREILLSSSAVVQCTNNTLASTSCVGGTSSANCKFRLPQSQTDGWDPVAATYTKADLPQMALVSGSADPLECVLMKAGLSPSEISSYDVNSSAKLHYFQSDDAPGSRLDPHFGHQKNGSILWVGDAGTVAPGMYDYYDVVLFPCEGAAIDKHIHKTGSAGSSTDPYANLINYSNLGGRAFITHFGYVWMEYPSSKGYVTGDNWAGIANWVSTNGTTFTQDPMTASINTTATLGGTFTKGQAFSSWLFNTGASTTAGQLIIHEGRQDLTTVMSTTNNVQDWMTATDSYPPYGVTGHYDPHFTFQPQLDAGANACGEVVYSDFHVAASALVSGSATCYSDSQCGYGQVCDGGSTGANGTCSEPCAVTSDCHDSTYACVGATAGTCQPVSCVPGGYVCSIGGCYMPGSTPLGCVCTNDNQCASLHCNNVDSLCAGGACTGDGGATATNCNADSYTVCTNSSTYTCSDSHYTCSSGSGPCNGVTTGTIGTPITDGGIVVVDAGLSCSVRSGPSTTCGPTTSSATPAFYTGSATSPTTAASGFTTVSLTQTAGNGTYSTVKTLGSGGTVLPWPSLASVYLNNTPAGWVFVKRNGTATSSNYDCQLGYGQDQCDEAILSSTDYVTVVLYGGGAGDSVNLSLNAATCGSGQVLALDTIANNLTHSNRYPLGCNLSGSGGTCYNSPQPECASYTGSNSLQFPPYCSSCNNSCAGSGGACDTVYDAGAGGGGTCCEETACSGSATYVDAGGAFGECCTYFCDAGTLGATTSVTDAGHLPTNQTYSTHNWAQINGGASFDAGGVAFPANTILVYTVSPIITSSPTGDETQTVWNEITDPSVSISYCASQNNTVGSSNVCIIQASAATYYAFYADTGFYSTDTFTATLQEYSPCPAGSSLYVNGSIASLPWNATSYNGAVTLSCVNPTACSVTVDAGVTCASGVSNDAGTQCLCTADNQCPTGVCNSWSGCTDGGCSGDGGAGTDLHFCADASPTCSTTSSVFTCPLSGGGGCIDAGSGTENCHCTSNSQCTATGSLCQTWSGCTTDGGCTGSGAATTNDFGCTLPGSVFGSTAVSCTASTYACSAPAVCNDAGTYCWCTADNQCPSGQCGTWGGCADGGCSGSGAAVVDNAHCIAATDAGINCSSNSSCGSSTTQVEFCAGVGDGGSGLGQCHKSCTLSSQCTGGETCVDGGCTGCTSTTQCSDQTYPASCIGGSGAHTGTCCNSWDGGSCGLNNSLFPEACLQAPMTAQEKALEFMFFDLTACVTQDAYDGGPSIPPILLSPETFSLDFQASCPMGQQARWREFDYQATFPTTASGASITFAAQTGQIGADAASFVPSTALNLLTTSTTITGSTWGAIVIDTSPGGDGGFTTSGIVSQNDLRMWITLTPTTDQLQSPVLAAWSTKYDCAATE